MRRRACASWWRRALPHANETRSIQWQNPDARGATFRFNMSVRVEYLNEKSRAPQVEVLEGVSAYCVQALRAALSPSVGRIWIKRVPR